MQVLPWPMVPGACPIDPIAEFERDVRAFHFAGLFRRPYEGPFGLESGTSGRSSGEFETRDNGVFELHGRHFRGIKGPKVIWHQAEDDVNFRVPVTASEPTLTPRH